MSDPLGTCDNQATLHPKRLEGEQCSDLCVNWVPQIPQETIEEHMQNLGFTVLKEKKEETK